MTDTEAAVNPYRSRKRGFMENVVQVCGVGRGGGGEEEWQSVPLGVLAVNSGSK